MTRTIALFCLSIATCAAVGFAEERTWTDTTGRSMKAEFLRLEGTDVVFRKEGKEVTVPISRLSPQDRDAVRALSEQGDAENPFEAGAVENPFGAGAVENPFEVDAVDKDSVESPPDATEKPQRIEQRIWTDVQGRQIKAKFVRINGRNVVLSRAGRISMVPYSNLSQADQDYVAELLKERGEEDKVPPVARGNKDDDTSGSHESSLGVGSGGSSVMPGSSRSFPGGMPGSSRGGRYPGAGLSSGGTPGPGLPGSMPSLPPMPSGMPGMSGGSSFPGGPPPSGYPGSSPSPSLGGSGYPDSMPSAGGYPGGPSSPPGMAGGASPSMGLGPSFPGSSAPSYPTTLGGPHGSSSMMGSGSSGMGRPSGMGGPYGGSGPPPDLPRFEFVYKCSQCLREFSESESKGKKHCPSCGVAWLNQGGTAGTFDKSAPNYNSQWDSSRTYWRTRGFHKLIIAIIAFLFSVLGGGATAYSRWNKS